MKNKDSTIKINNPLTSFLILLFILFYTLKLSANVLIEGFSKWQADRVEQIILDQAVLGMLDDKYFKAFFPETTREISRFGTNNNTQSLIPLIKEFIEIDVDNIETTFTVCTKGYLLEVVELSKSDVSASVDMVEKFDNALLNLTKDKHGNPIKLDVWYKNFQKVTCELKKDKVMKIDEKVISDRIIKHVDDDTKFIQESDKFIKSLNPVEINSVTSSSKSVNGFNLKTRKIGELSHNDDELIKQFIERINAMVSLINRYEVAKQNDSGDNDALLTLHYSIQFFELFGSDNQHYAKLRSLGLFLGALVEATEPEDIAAVLDTFVDTQGAFRNKRFSGNTALFSFFERTEYDVASKKEKKIKYTGSCGLGRGLFGFPIIPTCENSLFIGSYFGVAASRLPDEKTLKKGWDYRAFGPVGIETKVFDYYGHPVMLNASPFDFGNYINNELRDVEYTAKFSDVQAPSVFLSLSHKSRPFSVLVGYQWDIKIGNNIEEDAFFISVAFDLPIFTLR